MKTLLIYFLIYMACNQPSGEPVSGLTEAPGMNTNETIIDTPVVKIVKSEEEWKKELPAESFHVLREKGTERAFTSELLNIHEKGVFICKACRLPLFDESTKFDSGTGWPSFYKPISKNYVKEISDMSFGMARTEVVCARCGGHLGHIFDDGPKPTGLRYCINGVSLDFVKNSSK